MTANHLAPNRVRCRPPVAPLPTADTGAHGTDRTASPASSTTDEVGHFQLPQVGHFRLPLTARTLGPGSIPACAGEPAIVPLSWLRPGVYPRVCGGTSRSSYVVPFVRGLSPRVRGNRPGGSPRVVLEGSIPACAGEPWRRQASRTSRRVYPRVCGGTNCDSADSGIVKGLSPRVRGNPPRPSLPYFSHGSIPACAGEPPRRRSRPPQGSVYPRVCGGTTRGRRCCRSHPGLSPRVRGNPWRGDSSLATTRSIPACAGEPRSGARPWRGDRVYPRVCGGTLGTSTVEAAVAGLSPRVRGNLWPFWPIHPEACQAAQP